MRATILRSIVLLAVFLLSSPLATVRAAAGDTARPNLVVILIDDKY